MQDRPIMTCVSARRRRDLVEVSAHLSADRLPVSPDLEIARYEHLQKLRRLLTESCLKLGLDDLPSGLFEAFHFAWLARADMAVNRNEKDPLFPGVGSMSANEFCEGLRNELHRLGIRNKKALDIFESKIYKICQQLSRTLGSFATKISGSVQKDPAVVQKSDLGDKGVAFFYKGVTLRISHPHLSKLYELHRQNSANSNTAGLNVDIFCLLLRYKSLQGGGFQAALPACVFEALRTNFGVEMEGFASPLNCSFSCFCSAFPDTDAPFGSLGSFFHFQPRTGSFALNPPFVGDVILRAAEHCERLLRTAAAARLPLSFVIVVGASETARRHAAWARLCAGEFRQTAEPMLLKVICRPATRCGAPALTARRRGGR